MALKFINLLIYKQMIKIIRFFAPPIGQNLSWLGKMGYFWSLAGGATAFKRKLSTF